MIHGLIGPLILFAAVLLNTASISAAAPAPDPDEAALPYSDFLAAKSSAPVDYIISKFRDYQVVSIGEIHENANSLDFLQAILKDRQFIEEVGVLVWEFGSIQDQNIVDRALNAEQWNDKELISAYKRHTHPWGWPFKNYIDVYHTAWKTNHSGQGKITIINADVPIDWGAIKSREDYEKAMSKRDEHMAGVIEDRIIKKGLKALFYAGEGHANKLNANKKRNTALNLLLTKYPNKIFSITLHKEAGYDESAAQYLRVCDGLFDYAFNLNGSAKPTAFDLNDSPFGRIDGKCAQFIPAGYKLQEMYDGYVYLGPLENYRHVDFIKGFYDKAYLKKVAKRTKLAFGQELTEICGISAVSEFPAFWENSGKTTRKFQPIDAWKTKSGPG
ncbi:MAG: hypothetical protein A2X28_08690 [Elusimicrobia bacterium GWA2_56_46]|nr:MAG: hypothetical protein A2X28_08690 [Elusimicrobia bacterium GWA2_56_46]OGR55212.1 MAG: hypothetical protein A2X39_01595 [Elusimicrobia bacterium GWC2_56_31]HBW23714.1 hypothetical protein [Elusimicrobiota bacterium]